MILYSYIIKLLFISDTSRTNAHCSYDEKSQTMYMECPGLTCFTQHENILFLGYNSGKVILYIFYTKFYVDLVLA